MKKQKRYPMKGPTMRVQRDYYEGRISGSQFANYCALIKAGQSPNQAEAQAIR